MTELLYIWIMLTAYILSCLAQRERKKVYLFFLIALLTCAAGFRGITCGVDTPSYYENIQNGFPKHWLFREQGFRFVANFFMNTFGNPQLMFIFCALITNLLIFLRLWDFHTDYSFSFMSLLYILLYYGNSLNIMRQYVAVAFIFYGTRFLPKSKILFGACLIIAFFFHRSALIAAGYLIVYLWVGFTKKQKQLFIVPIAVGTCAVVFYVISYLQSDIQAYSTLKINNLNITYFYLLLITVFTIIQDKFKIHIIFRTQFLQRRDDGFVTCYKMDKKLMSYMLCGLALSALSMFFAFVGRVGLYYDIYSVVYWGMAGKKMRNAQLNRILILIYALYIFGLLIFRNDGKLFPYSLYLY